MSEANELTESLMKINAITEASYPATQADIIRNIKKIARKALAEMKTEDSLTFIRPLAYVTDFNFSSMSGLKPFGTEQSVGFYNAIYGQDAIDSLKAEIVEATEMALGQAKTLIEKDKRIAELEALESAFAEYERETETVPVGHENRMNGAVTYNWRTRMAQEIRSKAARLREGETE